jgi:hypothetical protein
MTNIWFVLGDQLISGMKKSDFGTAEFLWKDEFGRKCVNKPDILVVGSTYIIVIYIGFSKIR